MGTNLNKIDNMALNELLEAQNKIADIIKQKQVQQKDDLLASFQKQAADAGLSIARVVWADEVASSGKKGGSDKPKRIFKPKYRNPDDPSETWTGLGKPAKWIQAKMNAGHDKEEFRIPEDER